MIGLAITLYFIVFVGRKNKYGNIHNIIFISIKFCVIIFVIVAGIIIFSTGHYTHSEENSGINISNTLGIINCLPGVMFLLKLFYSCPGLENKLEKKESFSRDLLIGISVASAILFILSIFMVFCTVDGSIDTLQYYFNNGTGKIIMRIVLVAVGIFSLAGVNSYAIYINEFYGEMVKNNTLIFSKFFNKIARNKSTNTVGIYPLLTLYLILFLIFIPLGGLINLSYTKYNVSGFGADNLYCMTDFLGN
ncbi:hypothetical protein FACS189459_6610 [Bacilli bacterium]|nr:hypothetical protein FACS189459_6610 [Bacilli bacterium]